MWDLEESADNIWKFLKPPRRRIVTASINGSEAEVICEAARRLLAQELMA